MLCGVVVVDVEVDVIVKFGCVDLFDEGYVIGWMCVVMYVEWDVGWV